MDSKALYSIWLVLSCVIVTQGSPPLQLQDLRGFDDETPRIPETLQNVRLPRNVNPLHYDLRIRPIVSPDPDQFKAPGWVKIRIRCVSPTNSIVLHSNDIEIEHDNVTVTAVASGQPIPVESHSIDSNISTYSINLGMTLQSTLEYDVEIPFMANVGDRLYGLYRSSYMDDTGNRRYIATTQFQKLGARTAFPCFDEPNFRSTFNITIGRPALGGYHSLCNSARLQTIANPDLPGWVWDVYDKTVSMPAYLIAIIVSDFESVDAPPQWSRYTVKTWGPPPMTDNKTGEFSALAAAKILTFLETYYDSPYQFPKLDSVAIPDFEAGAMENWALNTYRIVLMLWFEGESTQFEQWRQAAVIAHEIVHHWFGDLVTCDWWNDIWLNEGFARYMQFIGANASLTEHGVMDRYTIDVIQPAMEYDAGPNTEPVRSDVTDQVTNQASRIVYEKAAALLRMIQGFLSEETLIMALRVYLDKYAYNNTVQDQLFAELQVQADLDGTAPMYSVKEIMDTWTLKSGFPIVTVRRAGSNVVYLSQERFRPLEQRLSQPQQDNTFWYIPVTYATKMNPDFTPANWKPKFWIDKYTLTTSKIIPELAENDWFILNPDARSYYRVLYDDYFFSLILEQLSANHTTISLSSRSQLIDDYFKSAFAGYVHINKTLDLTEYLDEEMENTVWTAVLSASNLRTIHRLLQEEPTIHAEFRRYMLTKIEPVLDTIGWKSQTSDKPVTIILRSQLLDWACMLGSENCMTLAVEYAEGLNQTESIPADYQPAMYCKAVGLAKSDSITFNIIEHIMEGYKSAWRVERHNVMINALACTNQSDVEALLDSLNPMFNPSPDFIGSHRIQLIQRIAEVPENRGDIMLFLRMNWLSMASGIGGWDTTPMSVANIITSLASYTSQSSAVLEVRAFADFLERDHGAYPGLVNALNAARQRMTDNQQWMNTYSTSISAWLASR